MRNDFHRNPYHKNTSISQVTYLQRDRSEDLRVTDIVETKGEPLKKLIIVQHRRSMSEKAFGSKEELSLHQRRIKYQIEPVNAAGWLAYSGILRSNANLLSYHF